MTAYADSSALVKRYLDEVHGGELVRDRPALITSTLAAVEVCAAIWRRQRMGEVEPADAAYLADRARHDLTGGEPSVIAIPPTNPILIDASRLAGTAGLRAYDAIQLATARAAREVYPDCTEFVCFDRGLSAAAAADGFTVLG